MLSGSSITPRMGDFPAFHPAVQPFWTLATYNVHDLFDHDGSGAHHERPTPNHLANKLTRLGRLLHILGADVVGLMEVETLRVLRRLNDRYLAGLGYREAILIEGNDPERGIDVALLSRFQADRIVSHAGDTYTDDSGQIRRVFSRDCLECHLRLPDGSPLAILVNHFKSKRSGIAETENLRRAQAVRVRALCERLAPEMPRIAVIGDLNDTPDSETLRILLGAGGSCPLSDLARDVPPGQGDTFVHAGQPERLDYVLASPGLAAGFVPGSVLIPQDTFARRASDHAPVRATFAFPPAATYLPDLTTLYNREHPPVRRGRVPARINAARFFAHDLHPLQGQLVIVTGMVRRVQETSGTGVLRLFLGHADPARAFRVVIFPEERSLWTQNGIGDVAGYYLHRMVQGVGILQFYQGAPEITAPAPGRLRAITQSL